MLSVFGSLSKAVLPGEVFAHVVTGEQGRILDANPKFVELAGAVAQKKLSLKGVIGKTVKDVFGKEINNTVVGTFLRQKDKRSSSGHFMISGQLYQVIVEAITENDQKLFEFFYFPITANEGCSQELFLQSITYELAVQQGFADPEWILHTSDEHCKQLITCLTNHEHTTQPAGCCPYKLRCKFNPDHGALQLDRRVYFRSVVALAGDLYLLAFKDRPLPPEIMTKKTPCQALDLSIGGVKLALNVSLPLESVVRVVFAEFACEGTVVWIQDRGEEWLAGIKFCNMTHEQQYQIIKVITKSRTGR